MRGLMRVLAQQGGGSGKSSAGRATSGSTTGRNNARTAGGSTTSRNGSRLKKVASGRGVAQPRNSK